MLDVSLDVLQQFHLTHIFIWAAIIILLPVFGERYRNKVNIVAGDADTDMSHLVSIVDH